jgi:hypothetical protein
MEPSMRDLGTAGEKFFGGLCAAAGMAANKSDTDVNGWDLFIEIDTASDTLDRMTMHEGLIETKVQVKSTDGNKKSVDVELSNLRKMATSSLPCFYVLLEFDGGDFPARAYLRHFDNDLVAKTLRRVSDEYAKNPKAKLNKKRMRLNFEEPIHPISASTLKKMVNSHIGLSYLDYLEQKHGYLKSVGFEEGTHRIKFSIVGDDKLEELIDISLGNNSTIQVGNVHGSSLRFGVSSDRPELSSESALLAMPDVMPSDQGLIIFRDKSTGRILKFGVDLYTSPFNSWVPKNYRKIRMDAKLFEFHILNYGKSFNISMNIHLLEQFEIEEALRMFKLTHMLSAPQNIELTFKFQELLSTAHLKHGECFPEQSQTIEYLEKLVKIKRYYDTDTPLHLNIHQIEKSRTKLDQLMPVIEGKPEIFKLNFSSTDEIPHDIEIECFYLLSFQIGNYLFLELILFLGKVEKTPDDRYSITPEAKSSFYKTMVDTRDFNKSILREDITNLVENYESARPVINFTPSFFEELEAQ